MEILLHNNDTQNRKTKRWSKTLPPDQFTNFIFKNFCKALLPKLLEFLENLIPDAQFWFRTLHSGPQQLHRVTDVILDTFEEKKVYLGLFIDTEKVFD
jgi:hypothetical protein